MDGAIAWILTNLIGPETLGAIGLAVFGYVAKLARDYLATIRNDSARQVALDVFDRAAEFARAKIVELTKKGVPADTAKETAMALATAYVGNAAPDSLKALHIGSAGVRDRIEVRLTTNPPLPVS